MSKKILIVDDEPGLRKALVDKFTQAGFEVLSAQNGQDGLTSAIKNKPDIILLDVLMPVMDGVTMLAELRKDDWGKSAKVIMLTNVPEAGKTNDLNVTRYLVKAEWKIADVVKHVSELVK